MFGDLDLKPFLWTLNLYGLFNCDFVDSYDEDGYFRRTLHNRVHSVAVLLLVQALCAFLFLYWLLFRKQFDIDAYNSTGNIYLNINYAFGCVLVSVIYFYFFTGQLCFMQTLDTVLRYQEEFSQYRCSNWNLRHWFWIYVFLATTEILNNYRAFESTNVATLANICFQLMSNLVFLLCGIIILLYVAVIKIIKSCLRHVNKEIHRLLLGKKSKGKNRNLKEWMASRKKLLDFCQNELSERFGIILLVILAFMVFSAPSGPFYFISVTLKLGFEYNWAFACNAIMVFYWSVPWVIVFIAVMSCTVEEQVNNHKYLREGK